MNGRERFLRDQILVRPNVASTTGQGRESGRVTLKLWSACRAPDARNLGVAPSSLTGNSEPLSCR
jgi:hypothetical protein